MKAPKVNIDFLKQLGIIRDYASVVWPCVIAIIALLLLIPAHMMSGKLQKTVRKESISKSKTVQQLTKETVPKNQYKEEQKYQDAYLEDVNQIQKIVARSSQRELLRYDIFPEPNEVSPLLFKEQFGMAFLTSIETMLKEQNAGACPSERDLEKSLTDVFVDKENSSSSGDNKEQIINAVCIERADNISVYASSFDIAGFDFWANYEYIGLEQALIDCWYWQTGYWIIEDVLSTIKTLNKNSLKVATSPFKRLVYLGFQDGVSRGSKNRITLDPSDMPQYASYDFGMLIQPHTNRVTNDEIDVIHFTIIAILEADQVLPFFAELHKAKPHLWRGYDGEQTPEEYFHNSITVLESQIRLVDRNEDIHELYRYGEKAVVEVSLICEYVFDKSGYSPWIPKIITGAEDSGSLSDSSSFEKRKISR